MQDLGTYERRGDHVDVCFERIYPRAPERVWQALTDPERLADWMGASRVEPRVGGAFETMLDGPYPSTGTVSVWDPPNALEFTWSNGHSPDATIRYELTPHAAGTRVVFTHSHMPHASIMLMLPGWHTYFVRLERLLGDDEPPAWEKRWRQMQTIYSQHYGLTGLQLDP